MSGFTSPLKYKEVGGGFICTMDDVVYDVGYEGSQESVRVPEGYATDLSSIPKFLRGWFLSGGLYTRAAVVHDFLYSMRGRRPRAFSPVDSSWSFQHYDQSEVNFIFLEAMRVLGMGVLRRELAWVSVGLLSRFEREPEFGTLSENEVFVFGSNMAGLLTRGSALQARYDAGHRAGCAEGLTGRCYALPILTKDLCWRSEADLLESVAKLYRTAEALPRQCFLVSNICSEFGKVDMRDLFTMAPWTTPRNVILPSEWRMRGPHDCD